MNREPLKAWGDDVALNGPEVPRNTGQIKWLIEYLLTTYERFGNTAVTFTLQWGATALWKRDEQAKRIAELEEQLAAPRAEVGTQREAALQAQIDRLMLEYCPEEMTPEQVEEWGKHQRPASP